jgi:hypothetical protein
MTERDEYTAEEIKLIREQLRNGTAAAREAVKKRSIKLHPKIAAMRADDRPDDGEELDRKP